MTGCDKELDLYADYEDYTIVYGLINPKDSISYIRIERAFLSKEDIFQSAQIADSNLYSYKLDVKLISGNKTIDFDTLTINNKEGGIFYAPKMQVYVANTLNCFDLDQNLKLEICNPRTGKKTHSTILLHDASGIPIGYQFTTITFEEDRAIYFRTIENIKNYQLCLRLHYLEQIKDDTNSAENKYIDWSFPTIRSRTLFGDEQISASYIGQGFYNNLLNNIPPSEILERYYGKIEMIVFTSDEHLFAYNESCSISNTVVMNKKTYSNIENGIGVFAATSSGSEYIRINNQSKTRIRNLAGLNFVGGIPE